MKWFKHISGSLNDSLIFEAIENFGSDGYLVFFGILELMSDEFDIYNPGKNEISLKKITKNLQLSRQKTVRILAFFNEKAKINQKKNIGFYADVKDSMVYLNCPRLKELTDEYTKKQLQKLSGQKPDPNRDKLRPKEEEVEVDKEEEVEEIKKNTKKKIKKEHIYTESFMNFWGIYPRKVNKSGAFESWETLDPDDKLVNDIINALNLQLKYNILDLRDNNKYCPHPTSWLNQKRWEDEIQITDTTSEIGGMDALKRFAEKHNVDMGDGND